MSGRNKKGKKTKRKGFGKLLFGLLFSLISLFFIGSALLFRFDEWKELDPELILSCPQSLKIYDGSGELISIRGKEKRIWISTDELKPVTCGAFIAAEDNRFYNHGGIDVYRVFGAAWADIKAGGFVQGASTISQQLIKLSHLSSEKTIDRKLEETALALRLEKCFDKNEILEMYLNYVYFGGGFYGIETAALGYFGVHAKELSAAQSAQLAGILKSPSSYAPHIDPEASLNRRNHILGLMKEQGCIDEEEYASAINEEVELKNGIPDMKSALIDRAVKEAAEKIGTEQEELLNGGYSIYTSINVGITEKCSELINDPSLIPSDKAQAAIVVIGDCGNIEAMIGGRGEQDGEGINRAVDMERQPGSLIKPLLVYAPAVELYGYSAATVLKDERKSFGDYSPRNSDDKYFGNVTLREAVARSLNVPAVEVLSDIGVSSGISFASALGVSFENEAPGLPLALGGFTHGVSPIEMAGAYSAFANEGVYIEPAAVVRIEDRYGNVVYSRELSGRRVMSRENAFLLTSMLQSAANEGTAKRLASTGLPLAAKTGTSIDENGVRDAWCAAFSTDHTAVIWMGMDSAAEGSLPGEAVGGNQPTLTLAKLFEYIYGESPCKPAEKPEGIIEKDIDVSEIDKGIVFEASEYTPRDYIRHEYFKAGNEPVEANPRWERPRPPEKLGWTVNEKGMPVISFEAVPSLTYKLYRSGAKGNELIAEAEGVSGYVSFTDGSAIPGEALTYTVIAENPEVTDENGSSLSSEPSRELHLIVPRF